MNGSLIIGTMDGANVEIGEAVGFENMFIFGARTDVKFPAKKFVHLFRKRQQSVSALPRLLTIVCTMYYLGAFVTVYCKLKFISIEAGQFGKADVYKPLITPLWTGNDYYLVSYDFPLYLAAQKAVDDLWRDQNKWYQQCIKTIAGMGPFSSDNSIDQYARNVWKLKPCKMTPGVQSTSTVIKRKDPEHLAI